MQLHVPYVSSTLIATSTVLISLEQGSTVPRYWYQPYETAISLSLNFDRLSTCLCRYEVFRDLGFNFGWCNSSATFVLVPATYISYPVKPVQYLPHNFGSRTLGWALALDNIFTATHTYPQTSKKQSKFPLLFNHQSIG